MKCGLSGVEVESAGKVRGGRRWRDYANKLPLTETGDLPECGVDCDFRRNISKPTISRYQTRYAQVGPSARARARRRAREPPESEFRELTEMLSTISCRT